MLVAFCYLGLEKIAERAARGKDLRQRTAYGDLASDPVGLRKSLLSWCGSGELEKEKRGFTLKRYRTGGFALPVQVCSGQLAGITLKRWKRLECPALLFGPAIQKGNATPSRLFPAEAKRQAGSRPSTLRACSGWHMRNRIINAANQHP
jgi:hypothetical protein